MCSEDFLHSQFIIVLLCLPFTWPGATQQAPPYLRNGYDEGRFGPNAAWRERYFRQNRSLRDKNPRPYLSFLQVGDADVHMNLRTILSTEAPMPMAPSDDSEAEGGAGPEVDPYDRFPAHRKNTMLAIMAWCGLLSPVSSTAILSAIPEVASTFNTTGSMISLSNALYLVFMALSPCFWGPSCQVFGRKTVCSCLVSPQLSLEPRHTNSNISAASPRAARSFSAPSPPPWHPTLPLSSSSA